MSETQFGAGFTHTVSDLPSMTTMPSVRRNEAPSWAAGVSMAAMPPQLLGILRNRL